MTFKIVITPDVMAEALALLLHVKYGTEVPQVQVFESDQGYFADVSLFDKLPIIAT